MAQDDGPAPMEPIGASACDPPFAGSPCPIPETAVRSCRPTEHATRDGVTAELVEDGYDIDLMAVHLVVRRGADAWIRRELGHRGVGCGTDGLVGAELRLDELSVRDVLYGPAPEVILRRNVDERGDWMLVCTTDVTPPRCTDFWVTRGSRVRYRRPGTVRYDSVETDPGSLP